MVVGVDPGADDDLETGFLSEFPARLDVATEQHGGRLDDRSHAMGLDRLG
jgi:hypothetical protein